MADTLSVEIIEMIVMELEEYGITAEPDVKFFSPTLNIATTNTSDDEVEPGHDNDYTIETPTWITLTKSARHNILHIRLVSRAFKEASDRSFVKVLEERSFSTAQGDLNLLIAISQDKQMANWFHALTLDCGKPVYTDDEDSEINDADVQDGLRGRSVDLTTALRAFPNQRYSHGR
jgi:hypothetical protein